ncbi:MAG TPA: L-seryl-tRNA(Sec) selenium transferase [Acidimicrobiales bacterium]|nr:L-seryl-tRNA(Sec) selenium transferase [Acidimicrobiales bacterium]
MVSKYPPSVDQLARSLKDTGLPHPLLVDAARLAISEGDSEDVQVRARNIAELMASSLLTDVVNATGVLLHTNMGRAPVDVTINSGRYTNLELDLITGNRGSRQDRVPLLLAKACGAEAAIVVNNCASAVMLVLAALAEGESVGVSRGELVEIGGGFRIPEVITQSGAKLVEVGTTNRTRVKDFAKAVTKRNVVLNLSVHQSNYRIEGFTESVKISELAELDVPVVADIGSGLLDAACPWLESGPPAWLRNEPAARQTLEAGADLVTFSGDKLLGGPQVGIIAGKADLVKACSSHPLARALRPGGLVLNALEKIVLSYLNRDGNAIPFWRMATLTVEELHARAEVINPLWVGDTFSTPGGGTLPGVEIPSVGLVVPGDYSESLRLNDPPIICRVVDNSTICDLRTVHPDDDEVVAAALEAAVS